MRGDIDIQHSHEFYDPGALVHWFISATQRLHLLICFSCDCDFQGQDHPPPALSQVLYIFKQRLILVQISRKVSRGTVNHRLKLRKGQYYGGQWCLWTAL